MRILFRFRLYTVVFGVAASMAIACVSAAGTSRFEGHASSAGARATVVAAGLFHTCTVTTAGSARCWGANADGQLGDGTTRKHLRPVAVAGLAARVRAIAAGRSHTCAITRAGKVECWGWNLHGQLGNGTTADRHEPVVVPGLAGVVAIAAGHTHTCAVTRLGAVRCWGENVHGQLGDGTTVERHRPVPVSGLTTGVVSIAAGRWHTCALTSAGAVECWGDNYNGELGDGTTIDSHAPVDVSGLGTGVFAISAGGLHTCAVTGAGGAKCWGNNYDGQLGDGTKWNDRHTPVDVFGLTSGVAAIAAGREHTCALTSGGAVKCWGWNFWGALGDGTGGYCDGDVCRSLVPVDTSGLASGVDTIGAGYTHTCALTMAGLVECWGGNGHGQVGDGTKTNRYEPVAVELGAAAPLRCVVPKVVGRTLAGAKTAIARAHCRVGTVTRVTSMKRKNSVVGQSPRPGKRLKKGARVNLKVSRGR